MVATVVPVSACSTVPALAAAGLPMCASAVAICLTACSSRPEVVVQARLVHHKVTRQVATVASSLAKTAIHIPQELNHIAGMAVIRIAHPVAGNLASVQPVQTTAFMEVAVAAAVGAEVVEAQ